MKTWLCSMQFWLGLAAVAASVWAYFNNDRSMYVLGATCAGLIIALRWSDSLPGPVPTEKSPPMEVIGGQMRYPTRKAA